MQSKADTFSGRRRRCLVMHNIRHALAVCLGFLGIAGLIMWSGGRGAMAQPGFVSVDCGAPAGTYNDTNNGIEWISDDNPDADFAKGVQGDGVSMTAAVQRQPPAGNATKSLGTLRYFPSDRLSKYCYIFSEDDFDFVQSGTAVLVRATFWAGDLTLFAAGDNQSGTPTSVIFQLLLNADIWDNVTVTLPQQDVVIKEVYVFPFNSTLPASVSVCLASGSILGMGIPFISSLELRVIPAKVQAWLLTDFQLPLHSIYAVDYGASPGQGVTRYPDDLMDRIWQPDTLHVPTQSTTRPVVPAESTSSSPMPPVKVMRTAYVEDEKIALVFNVPFGVYYVAEYLFEVSAAAMNQSGQRVFIWQLTGYAPSDPVDMYDASWWLLFSGSASPLHPDRNGQLIFTITKAPNSTEGPLISALLLFRDFGDVSPGSNTQDVDIINDIQMKYFPTLRAWIGDPCLPYPYNWLNCTIEKKFPRILNIFLSNKSLEGGFPPRIALLKSITSIYLDHNKLSGSIPDLNGLENLQILDLSNNNFGGQIPSSLANLPSLTTLLLDNNSFVGEIPSSILQKFSSPNFVFSFSGNPLLCNGTSCSPKPKPKRYYIIPLAIFFVAIFIFGGCCCWKKWKKHKKMAVLTQVGNPRDCTTFTFNEIKTITDHFRQTLGQGAFGPVYYGELQNGRSVAVKVLAATSGQGEREFLNKVNFLSRIHHRSLVPLLGYCVEEQLVLVYEYMAGGSLYQAIEGNRSLLSTWPAYLRVAVDAAEGLEYLHHGCDPEVIHRDVKSSNILIGRDMQGKLSNFGISRSTTATAAGAHMFTAVQGTFGYIDPEYVERQEVTNKVDVYAFGVVLLEICSGRYVFSGSAGNDSQNLVNWVKHHAERGDIREIMHPRFDGCYSMSVAWKVIEVAMRCVEFESRRRPNMSEVCLELKSAFQWSSKERHHLIPPSQLPQMSGLAKF